MHVCMTVSVSTPFLHKSKEQEGGEASARAAAAAAAATAAEWQRDTAAAAARRQRRRQQGEDSLEELAHKDDVAQHALARLQLRHCLATLLLAGSELGLLGGNLCGMVGGWWKEGEAG